MSKRKQSKEEPSDERRHDDDDDGFRRLAKTLMHVEEKKRFHVHVYRISGMGEVDIDDAPTQEEAMEKALALVKSHKLVCDQKSETKFIAIPFRVPPEGDDQ